MRSAFNLVMMKVLTWTIAITVKLVVMMKATVMMNDDPMDVDSNV